MRQGRTTPLSRDPSRGDRLGIIILGRGRSGTSLTASLVATSGAHVDNSIPPDSLNPQGYWESREIVDLNRRILASLGATLSWIPRLGPKWPEQPRLDHYRARARQVISELDSHPVWVMKDPRFSVTLPFWLPLLDRPIRFVVCVRNPLESIFSVKGSRRVTPMDFEQWYEFNSHALRNTTDHPRLIVHFHRYFDLQGSSQLAQLFEFLGLEPGERVRSVISPKLYRYRVPLRALLNDGRAPGRVKDFYLQLLKHRAFDNGILDYLTPLSVAGHESRAPSIRVLFFRVYGLVWFLFEDSPLHHRLPGALQNALARTIGMWSR